MKGAKLQVIADGEEIHNGEVIMCTTANGRFCGGGVESCPNALVSDGKIDILVVKKITRSFLIKIFPKFKEGKLFEIPEHKEISKSLTAKHIVIHPLEDKMKFVADGEIMETGTLGIKILPKAIRLLVP
jgi:diacylglycerol kinase family enzyme